MQPAGQPRHPEAIKAAIRAEAARAGFDACGFARVDDAFPAGAALRAFVAEGRHGSMRWMEETLERRAHPRAMWPAARSAVVLGLNYGPTGDPRAAQAQRDAGAISVYAQGDDYHDVVKTRLKALAGWMARTLAAEVKVFVDTAPLMEKPLAQRAGLGWQGKHTNLVSRRFGSWLFLGSVLTDAVLQPDAAETDHCGACRACVDACPTEALDSPYRLDARACLSYLTIEHAGPWPERYRRALGNRVYGCDDCLAACPWNKFAEIARESALHAREALRQPALEALARLDEGAFRAMFRKSPLRRIGRQRLVRNALYAIGNSGDARLAAAALALTEDASPLVADAAAWALARLQATADAPTS